MGSILISIVVMNSLEVHEELALLRRFIIHDSHGSRSQIEHLHFGISSMDSVDDLFLHLITNGVNCNCQFIMSHLVLWKNTDVIPLSLLGQL
jgi:hypothetical protein